MRDSESNSQESRGVLGWASSAIGGVTSFLGRIAGATSNSSPDSSLDGFTDVLTMMTAPATETKERSVDQSENIAISGSADIGYVTTTSPVHLQTIDYKEIKEPDGGPVFNSENPVLAVDISSINNLLVNSNNNQPVTFQSDDTEENKEQNEPYPSITTDTSRNNLDEESKRKRIDDGDVPLAPPLVDREMVTQIDDHVVQPSPPVPGPIKEKNEEEENKTQQVPSGLQEPSPAKKSKDDSQANVPQPAQEEQKDTSTAGLKLAAGLVWSALPGIGPFAAAIYSIEVASRRYEHDIASGESGLRAGFKAFGLGIAATAAAFSTIFIPSLSAGVTAAVALLDPDLDIPGKLFAKNKSPASEVPVAPPTAMPQNKEPVINEQAVSFAQKMQIGLSADHNSASLQSPVTPIIGVTNDHTKPGNVR